MTIAGIVFIALDDISGDFLCFNRIPGEITQSLVTNDDDDRPQEVIVFSFKLGSRNKCLAICLWNTDEISSSDGCGAEGVGGKPFCTLEIGVLGDVSVVAVIIVF